MDKTQKETLASVRLLESAAKLVAPDFSKEFLQKLSAIRQNLLNNDVVIAILGPFNQGKSTLLNAILGGKTLPVDLVPTTGTAIRVQYSATMKIRITFHSGETVESEELSLLEEYTSLEEDRQLRKIKQADIFIPNQFLQEGNVLVDLPGTNDRAEQDDFVKEQILGADIVIVMLNARKLWTQQESESLDSWVFQNGIKNILFVLNFLGLLEDEEQLKVLDRAYRIVNDLQVEFELTSNRMLFPVDALPALRAVKAKNISALHDSGFSRFSEALREEALLVRGQLSEIRMCKVEKLAKHITSVLEDEKLDLARQYEKTSSKRKSRNIKSRKEINRIRKSAEAKLRLLSNVFACEDEEEVKYLAQHLENNSFMSWKEEKAKLLRAQLQSISKDFDELRTSFKCNASINKLSQFRFPKEPDIFLPSQPSAPEGGYTGGGAATGAFIGTLIAPGIGSILGGVIGGWIGSESDESVKDGYRRRMQNYQHQVRFSYQQGAREYLEVVNQKVSAKIEAIETQLDQVIKSYTPIPPDKVEKRVQKKLARIKSSLSKIAGISSSKT